MTTSSIPADAPVAELERRFHAFAVDRLLAWSVYAGAGVAAWWWFLREGAVAAGIVLVAGTVLLVGLGFAVALGVRGTSPGRALTGLRVVDHATGKPIGVPRALLRTLILGSSALPLFGLGLATLAWTSVEDRTRERRGWHDHVTGSLVVDVRPQPIVEVEADDRPRHIVNLTAMRLMPHHQPERPAVEVPARSGVPRASRPEPEPAPPPPAPPAPPAPVAAAEPGPERTSVGRRRADVPPSTGWRVSFDSGESFVVEGLGLVGRRPEGRPGEPVQHAVPLVSQNMSISKTHAQFHLAADGALVVMDRGSTNGSILVRRGVSRELTAGKPATLLDGDRVLFGDREMRVSRAG